MRLTRLYLRNYRVYEEPADLELPPGLVGIYGPNGGGKSTLVEGIRFALYGRSRTANEELRTSGINADAVAEVEFEHEGHQYLVRRVVTGVNATVRASAHADGYQVAEGARDTTRYVHSVLGMDDAAFRASVFAEQKQLAAFSSQPPHERKRLVLQLLGITPLDAARDNARRDARAAEAQHERLRAMLPDLDQLRRQAEDAERAVVSSEEAAVAHEAADAAAQERLVAASTRAEELDVVRQEHELLVAEARSVRAERDRSASAAERLRAELADLDRAAQRLEALAPEAEGWREAEAQLRLVEAVVAARAVVDAIAVPPPPAPPDEEGTEAARQAAEAARAELAEVNGRRDAALAELERARRTVERAAELTGEADCPLCGQSLGEAFAEVQAHRAAELGEVEARVSTLEAERARLATRATDAARQATERARALRQARAAWEAHQRAVAERDQAVKARAEAEAALGRTATVEERAALVAEVDRRRRAADECLQIRGRLERRPHAVAELDVERLLAAEHQGRLESIEEKVGALGFEPEALADARRARHQARLDAEEAAARAAAARLATAEARARAEAASQRLAEGREQHARLDDLADEARHLSRVAELLHGFRNTQVAAVGPRLSVQAADLFGELTDNEYDRLEVDPETYELKVRDAGLLHGMSRFSGSEVDLANLALRVAISEHVRFQSGGAVGLLVLDEVFGPLDDDRKERMLLALERLKGRFRQVLVVTHDAAIKDQLPNAVQVTKLPGRRATARLVEAGF
ncbi:MAG TPA: SMC family ATPase [Acidimicrobiales bacterium]|nr:SMC family ATPase [Acidimicrobiales bacterium]